jgi:hypothetical protein
MPLRHVVLLELKPETSEETVATIVAALRELPSKIDTIRSYEVLVDLGLQEGNASVGVIAGFDDAEGWRAYGPHPAHQAIVQSLITPNVVKRTALQGDLSAV